MCRYGLHSGNSIRRVHHRSEIISTLHTGLDVLVPFLLLRRFHGLWKLVTTALFDMIIVNLDSGSYLHQTSEKALAMSEKEKKGRSSSDFGGC